MENGALCLEGTNVNVGDFVWAENERPSSVCADHGELAGGEGNKQKQSKTFPEVDLSLSDEELVPLLRSAAVSWGFFRVFHHDIPQALIDSIAAHALRFFSLPLVDKLTISRYTTTPVSPIGYTGIANSAIVKAWSEALIVMPGEERICGLLNRVPSLSDRASFCTDLIEYFRRVGMLAMRIIHLLFRGLDLHETEIKALFENIDSSTVRINYYPACPVANLTYGSPPHKDFGGLAILHQDDVGGLEVLKEGEWVGVNPKKGHLIVNVGDLIQVWSNGIYKSVLHRSRVHSSQPRLSFVFFYFPPDEDVIAPMVKLVTEDSPAKYRPFYLREFTSMFVKALKAKHSPLLFYEASL